jgi:hypothetical protein
VLPARLYPANRFGHKADDHDPHRARQLHAFVTQKSLIQSVVADAKVQDPKTFLS